jgi:hypothetical protein
MSAYSQWMTPDAIVIYPSWKRALLPLLICGGFVAVGFFLYSGPAGDEDAHFVGLLCILVFGGAMIYPLARLLRHAPTLIIHSSGVVDNGSALSVGFLPWHEMARVEIVQFGSQRYLAIGVKNRETLLRAQSGLKALILKFNSKTFGTATYISSLSLSMPLEEIVSAIRERRRAAGHRELEYEWVTNSSE